MYEQISTGHLVSWNLDVQAKDLKDKKKDAYSDTVQDDTVQSSVWDSPLSDLMDIMSSIGEILSQEEAKVGFIFFIVE